ncbi:hypothetical protein Salat_1331100 [Sesamum alatum]|uniref:H15 domain-containing protein n=1 Tax=Sesamum alatum TaxID=300844 RepID=A0AAE1YHI6_9LAMI|nr:hypothetical protein Salat_1331100 [Sesamum alatum]
MDAQTPQPFSDSESLFHSSTNHVKRTTSGKKAMEKFRALVFKLAEAQSGKPLTAAAQTHVRSRLNQFFSQYRTPDHPPYSPMIERALRELNEKGSREESISQFLEKEYNGLPWAHSTLLKDHLGELCESGDIVVTRGTRGKRYMLVGSLKATSRKSKRRPPLKKREYGTESHDSDYLPGIVTKP